MSVKSLPVDCQILHDPRARMAKVEAFCAPWCSANELPCLREHHLADVDVSRQESGLAISEVVFPQPPEPIVEAERLEVRPGRAKVISPGDECLGIILPENALANDGNAEPLAQRFQHLRRGQHSTGKNVALDEIDFAAVGLEQAILNGDGLNAGKAAGQQPVTQL